MTRLDDIRARLEKATPGPWPSKRTSDHCQNITIGEQPISFKPGPDADLIAHAPDDLAALVKLVEAARKHYEVTEHLYDCVSYDESSLCDYCLEPINDDGPSKRCAKSPYKPYLDALDAALKPLMEG